MPATGYSPASSTRNRHEGDPDSVCQPHGHYPEVRHQRIEHRQHGGCFEVTISDIVPCPEWPRTLTRNKFNLEPGELGRSSYIVTPLFSETEGDSPVDYAFRVECHQHKRASEYDMTYDNPPSDTEYCFLSAYPKGPVEVQGAWERRYDGPARMFDVTSGSGDHRVLTGASFDGDTSESDSATYVHSYDYATVEYDEDGGQEWVARFTGLTLDTVPLLGASTVTTWLSLSVGPRSSQEPREHTPPYHSPSTTVTRLTLSAPSTIRWALASWMSRPRLGGTIYVAGTGDLLPSLPGDQTLVRSTDVAPPGRRPDSSAECDWHRRGA